MINPPHALLIFGILIWGAGPLRPAAADIIKNITLEDLKTRQQFDIPENANDQDDLLVVTITDAKWDTQGETRFREGSETGPIEDRVQFSNIDNKATIKFASDPQTLTALANPDFVDSVPEGSSFVKRLNANGMPIGMILSSDPEEFITSDFIVMQRLDVPEPASLALLGFGLVAFSFLKIVRRGPWPIRQYFYGSTSHFPLGRLACRPLRIPIAAVAGRVYVAGLRHRTDHAVWPRPQSIRRWISSSNPLAVVGNCGGTPGPAPGLRQVFSASFPMSDSRTGR
jgi:hypothetical protein